MTSSPEILLLIPFALIGLLIAQRVGAISATASVDRWSSAHGLRLTESNRPMVTLYLRSARRWRSLGALAGLVLPLAVSAALGADASDLSGGWSRVIAGYLVGAVAAQVALGRPLSGTGPSASLEPRQLDAYLPGFVRWVQRGVGAMSVVLAAVVAVVGFEEAESYGMGGLSGRAAVVLGPLGLVVAVLLEAGQRWIVTRPQPVVATDLLEADDAIRSQSISSIAAAGIAILLLLVGHLWWQLALSDVQLLRWTAWVPAIACWVAALASWLRFGHIPWRVVRASSVRSLGPT